MCLRLKIKGKEVFVALTLSLIPLSAVRQLLCGLRVFVGNYCVLFVYTATGAFIAGWDS